MVDFVVVDFSPHQHGTAGHPKNTQAKYPTSQYLERRNHSRPLRRKCPREMQHLPPCLAQSSLMIWIVDGAAEFLMLGEALLAAVAVS